MPRELSKEEIADIQAELPQDSQDYQSQQWHDKYIASLLYTLSLREKELEGLIFKTDARPSTDLRKKVEEQIELWKAESYNLTHSQYPERALIADRVVKSFEKLLSGSEVSVLGEVRKEVEEMPNLKLGRGISRESVLHILDKHAKGRQ